MNFKGRGDVFLIINDTGARVRVTGGKMDIIIPSVSIQQANNIRAQLKLPLLSAWTVKDMALRDVTPTQASDLVQFVSPPVVEPPVPPVPGPVPGVIDSLRVRNLGTIGVGSSPPLRMSVGTMKNEALVLRLADGFNVAKLYADAAQLARLYWVTPDLNAVPVWRRGDTARPKPGEYVVFRNMKAGEAIGTTLEINTERA